MAAGALLIRMEKAQRMRQMVLEAAKSFDEEGRGDIAVKMRLHMLPAGDESLARLYDLMEKYQPPLGQSKE